MNFQKYLNSLPALDNKKVIITGANSGIGFECASLVLKLNGKLVMACRNKQRALIAKEKLNSLYPDKEIDIILYDQSSLQSIKSFVNEITTNHSDFYALFLNAGVYHPGEIKETQDKFPITVGTNYISNLFLIDLLKPFLDKTNEEKRIIVQGSLASRLSFKKVDILDNTQTAFKQYCLSKFALYNLFVECNENNPNKLVKYLYVEPGITNSNITRNFPKAFRLIGSAFLKTFMMSTSKAALTGTSAIALELGGGECILPRGVFRITGFPKIFKIKQKYISSLYLVQGREVLSKWQER